MQRILEPGQIEALDRPDIPRIRLPDRGAVFARRAQRLRQLAGGSSIGDYLRLMATLAEAQQQAVEHLVPPLPEPQLIARCKEHGMPVVQATAWPRPPEWRAVLHGLAAALAQTPSFPAAVGELCSRLQNSPPAQLEALADALLESSTTVDDPAAAPLVLAALQVYWVGLSSRLAPEQVPMLEIAGLCPVCGTPPVASIVRTGQPQQGYRYLHCGLCATEWHLVRIKCSRCDGTKDIAYQGIEGGSEAVKAECCDSCHSYLKILYQEKDAAVEPVADDLASLALDLLLGEAGYSRSSGNPLLWQRPET